MSNIQDGSHSDGIAANVVSLLPFLGPGPQAVEKLDKLTARIRANLNELVETADALQVDLPEQARRAAVLLNASGAEAAEGSPAPRGTEPEDLAQALEASSVGAVTLDQLELRIVSLGDRLPYTSPRALREPLLQSCQRVTALLRAPQPVAKRRRLSTIAAQIAGIAGNVSFDLHDPIRAQGYYDVALIAAEDAGDPAVAAWVLGNNAYLLRHLGQGRQALDAVNRATTLAKRCAPATTQQAWLAALAAELHAMLGERGLTTRALQRAEQAMQRAQPDRRRPGIDFFSEAKLPAYAGSCFMLLGEPKLGEELSTEALELLTPGARSRSFVQFDLANIYLQQHELEEADQAIDRILQSSPHAEWTPRFFDRLDEIRQTLEPLARDTAARPLLSRLAAARGRSQ